MRFWLFFSSSPETYPVCCIEIHSGDVCIMFVDVRHCGGTVGFQKASYIQSICVELCRMNKSVQNMGKQQ